MQFPDISQILNFVNMSGLFLVHKRNISCRIVYYKAVWLLNNIGTGSEAIGDHVSLQNEQRKGGEGP